MAADRYVKMDFDRGEVSFALKTYRPDKNCHGRQLSSESIKQQVLDSPRLKSLMKEISLDMGTEEATIEKTAKEIVEEIGHKLSLPSVRTIAMLIRGTIRRVIRGIYLEKKGLEELRAAVKTHPVVILPSHRSYLDFLLVSYFMLEHDIQLPAIAAGQDFMNMQIAGSLLRRCGAFYMRRTFGSDRLYKLIFSLYLQSVLCNRDTPVEFFVEGTRSRTAKSLHPKLGLLSMVVEPYLHGALPDIILCPVSISYQRTFEETLFARELLGIPKPKESTSGLLKAPGLLSSDYGNVYVNFSRPISLHEVCLSWGISRIPHGVQPKDGFLLLPGEREMVTKLGYLILNKIDKGMRVFPSSLVAAVLLQNLTTGIEKDQLLYWTRVLKREVENRGGVVHWTARGGRQDDEAVINDTLDLLLLGGGILIEEDGALVKVASSVGQYQSKTRYTIGDLKEVQLTSSEKEAIFNTSFVHLLLGHYRNQIIHWFVPEAMLLLCLKGLPDITIDELQGKYSILWTALGQEFILPQRSPQIVLDETVLSLVDRGIVEIKGTTIFVAPFQLSENLANFFAKLIEPFVAGVWVMCLYLESLMGGVQTLKLTLKNTQLLATKLLHKGILSCYEILSLDVCKNAISSLNKGGLLFEPELELEGRDRLVKVAKPDKLRELTIELGSILFSQESPVSLVTSPSKL